MAAPLTLASSRHNVPMLRAAITAGTLPGWEALSRSGLLFQDVVPSLFAIAGALARLVGSAEFYQNLAWTLWEIGLALPVGIGAGVLVGLAVGANPLLRRAYVPYLYYLGSTPQLIFV